MLSIRDLTKQFGPVEALKSVNLDVRAGEIHGLVGANGSGKTTLFKILMGHPVIGQTGGYHGKILLDGVETLIDSPARAIALGIGMIHQEFTLLQEMTVVENVRIGRESTYRILERFLGKDLAMIRTGVDKARACRTLSRLDMEPHAEKLVGDLFSSLKPFVEIAREMDRSSLRLLLLDEPTSVLSAADAGRLAQILKELAAGGIAVMYVSHRLEEVTAVSDRVTVLRDGRVAARFERSEYSVQTLVECMTGSNVTKVHKPRQQKYSRVLMQIEDFHADVPGEKLCGASLEIMEGEILGVAGLSGHGKPAFGPGIMGIVPTSGKISLEGKLLQERNPTKMLGKGICYLPDDRTGSGLLMDHSVEDNIVFTTVHARGQLLKSPFLAGLSLLNEHSCRGLAEDWVERLQVKCSSVGQSVRELSGGNQQKVCLARALAVRPKMLIVAEPTRGVDVEARENLLQILLDLNHRRGMTILVTSSELDELRRLCDRIAVVFQGRIIDILGPQDDEVRFMAAFSGNRRNPK